ncbi:hypothetical protein TSOC_009739 [Tetrabaena socialis]|uniref:Uncharacterized protein n=1 Tax=Tetrabaena socialis TaxID=47790 RepID=A0A2J7ZV31_9CHLO|nr:hypothetical protein TSOC_009739 [Tetrabaena socialis]|eukprot:PNH04134.1 hypothetical protein TSOC_009739 [Tetrabaena socialis]
MDWITSCPVISGYTAAPDVDHSGDDIGRGSSVADATIKCNTDATCKGFNSDGAYKRLVSPTGAARGWCLYTKNTAGSCPAITGYTVAAPDTDHLGDDIDQGSSVQDATTKCDADTACLGFNSGGFYKRALYPLRYLFGSCLYTKIITSCLTISGYAAAPDVDHFGDDIAQASSVRDATAKCNADATCKSFNSGGWYKRSASITTGPYNNRGLCFYTKNVKGYIFIQYFDMPGFDLSCSPVGTRTVNDLGLLCTSTPGCQSFNVQGTTTLTSCLKTATPAMTSLEPQQTTYMTQPCMGIYVKGDGRVVSLRNVNQKCIDLPDGNQANGIQ